MTWTRNYWEDHCPECGELATIACKCPLNDRQCPNGHKWRRLKDGRFAMLENMHDEVTEWLSPIKEQS